MMSTISTPSYALRKATLSDADVIAQQTVDMAKETESRVLSFEQMRRGVQQTFDARSITDYYVVVTQETTADGEVESVAGFMMTAPFYTLRGPAVYTQLLQTVYVSPQHRRRGLFRLCYDHLRAVAEADPLCDGIRLYVEDSNESAQHAYTAMGMVREARVMMRWSRCGY